MTLKFLLLSAATIGALTLSAATPRQLSIEAGAHHPVISPDGTTVLYSSIDHSGLKAYDIESGRLTVIDQSAAAGFKPVFSTDGATVLYRTASMQDGLMYRDIRSFDMKRLEGKKLAAPSRKAANLHAMGGATTYAYADYKKINVTLNGESKLISPIADAHSYQWASLSPDASRLSFSEPYTGVYVANADGSNPVRILPKGDFVSWAGPSTLIAVISKDDGYEVYESRLVAININTMITTDLTPEGFLVGEAAASASGLVIYSNLEGQMFLIDLNEK